MISIDSFFPRVMPYVIGCSEPMARQAILDSAIKFCDDTLTLRQTVDTFKTISGNVSYDLETPNPQLRISRVISVTLDGRQIKGIFEEDIAGYPTAEGKPTGFYTTRVDSELVVNFYPVPDDAYSIVITAAFAPTMRATSLEDDLFEYWSEGIAAGAISRIAGMPNMPFTNEILSATMGVTADKGCSQGKIEGYYGRIRGGSRVNPRPLVR